jgi:hypothetical protein
MTSADQLEFADRIAFLRYIDTNGVLHTAREKIVLEARHASVMPEDLKVPAKANLAALDASFGASCRTAHSGQWKTAPLSGGARFRSAGRKGNFLRIFCFLGKAT